MIDLQGQVWQLVFNAIDHVNEELPENQRLKKEGATPLLDADDGVGSLTLIHMLLKVEEDAQVAFGNEILLTESEEIFSTDGPLRNLDEFVNFLTERIGQTDVQS